MARPPFVRRGRDRSPSTSPSTFGALLLLSLLVAALPFTTLYAGAPGSHPSAGPSRPATGLTSPRTGFAVNFTTASAGPLNQTFAASASGGTPPYQFAWSFGDGTTGVGQVVDHVYAEPGTYVVSLEATDAQGLHAFASKGVSVQGSSSSPVNVGWIVLGALAATLVGIALGIWASRRSIRLEAERDTVQGWVPTVPSAAGAPSRPPAYNVRPAPIVPRPSTGPATASAYRPFPAPLAAALPTISLRNPSAAPVTVTSRTAQPKGIPPEEQVPEGVQRLLAVRLGEGASLLEAVEDLNAVPWESVASQAASGSPRLLATTLAQLQPLLRTVRRDLLEPERARVLLRDVTHAWFQKGREASSPSTPSSPSSSASFSVPSAPSAQRSGDLHAVFASSETEGTGSLLDRMGITVRALAGRAMLRMAPVLGSLLALFLVVEGLTLGLLYGAYRLPITSPRVELIVAAAVLGPPTLVLALYPVAEWVHWLVAGARASALGVARLYALPSVRVLTYLLVLALAEISGAVADVVSGSLFGAPSSFFLGAEVSLWAVVSSLFLLLVTLLLSWLTISAWAFGGSKRTMWAAVGLYLTVFVIWAGAEVRLLLSIAEGPTWASVADARSLLAYLPADLLAASSFVVMLFVAFSEPAWQRSRSAKTGFRSQVAQAFVDDLRSHPCGATGVPLDHLSDLSRGHDGPRVAEALRELFTYDADSDRYVVLRWHDPASDTLLSVHIRQDGAGAYYTLDADAGTLSPSSSGDAGTSGADARSAPSGAIGPGSGLWARGDLTSSDAWLPVLRSKRTEGGRLAHPPSEVRDGANYGALIGLLSADSAAGSEARTLFRRCGWTKPSGPMLLVGLFQAAEQDQSLTPDIETDGEYLEVELNRATGHGADSPPFLGPWDLPGWHVAREVAIGGPAAGVSYRARRSSQAP